MRFSLWTTVLQWLQKSMTLILKGHTSLGQVCRMFWVSIKNCMIEKHVRLSNQAYCPIQACHVSHSTQWTSTFDIKADSHRRCRHNWPAWSDGFRQWWDVEKWPSSPLSYTLVSYTSHHPNLQWFSLTHHHHHLLAFQCACCLPDSGEGNYTINTLFLIYTGYVFITSFLLLLYVSVILGFNCYLAWFGKLFFGSENTQKVFHIN